MLHRHLKAILLTQILITTIVAAPALADGPFFRPLESGIEGLGSSEVQACTITPYTGGGTLRFWGDPDRWNTLYQRVGSTDCADCGGGSIQLNSVEFVSRSIADPTCSYRVEVSVVGAIEGACPAPDDANVICPPTVVSVTVPFSASAINVPLPAGCCVTGDAFVKLRWLDDVTCGGFFVHPALLEAADACAPCEQYFSTLTAYPSVTEMCGVLPSNLWLRINADCCEPTPMHERSWGRVKTMYR